MAGIKDVENRTWRTNYRGRLVIHAGSGIDREGMNEHGQLLANYPHAAILGTVKLVDCVQHSASPWAIAENWHWLLADPRPFDAPIPAKGKLGLWTCEADDMSLAEDDHLGTGRRDGRREGTGRKRQTIETRQENRS
jgi:hypothetical protein